MRQRICPESTQKKQHNGNVLRLTFMFRQASSVESLQTKGALRSCPFSTLSTLLAVRTVKLLHIHQCNHSWFVDGGLGAKRLEILCGGINHVLYKFDPFFWFRDTSGIQNVGVHEQPSEKAEYNLLSPVS